MPQAARKPDPVSPTIAAAENNVQALAANDPRWTGSQTKAASASGSPAPSQVADQASDKQAAAFAQPAAGTDATTELAKVAAPSAAAGGHPDGGQTRSHPAVQPQVPAQQPTAAEGDGSQAKAKPEKAAATRTGHILRAVTMRSGPKKNAAAIVTVPARTSVQVMSCKRWCQITYNGKTGWVYKTYIKTGA